MLNTYTNNYTSQVNIKAACIGTLQRSHPESFFKRFHKDSDMADEIFSNDPKLWLRDGDDYPKRLHLVVLQVMCFGDNEFLCELLDKDILNKGE